MKVHAVGRQRFRLISRDDNNFGEVEVLRETVLPPLLRSLSPLRALKVSRKKQLDLCCVMTNIPKFAIISTSLESQCEHLGNWMKMWFSEEKVQSALNLMTSIVCKACDSLICDMRDLINMNIEGNSSHFVNNDINGKLSNVECVWNILDGSLHHVDITRPSFTVFHSEV
uniref:Uncharacterized protein n=1 Tax=Heterorhabditis bacteriophora TaxID=37862 RepID=A0A1I7XS65_HETBA